MPLQKKRTSDPNSYFAEFYVTKTFEIFIFQCKTFNLVESYQFFVWFINKKRHISSSSRNPISRFRRINIFELEIKQVLINF